MQIPIQIEVERTPVLGMLHIPENQAPGSPMILMCYGLNGTVLITIVFPYRWECMRKKQELYYLALTTGD